MDQKFFKKFSKIIAENKKANNEKLRGKEKKNHTKKKKS